MNNGQETKCERCGRVFDFERFKTQVLGGCPMCDPIPWGLANAIAGPVRVIRQEKPGREITGEKIGYQPKLTGYCMGCGRGDLPGAPLSIGWLQGNGIYNQIHEFDECRKLHQLKTEAAHDELRLERLLEK